MNEIKDYFLIGDLHSAALVSKDASLDWLCLPHFDSPSIFAKLLDEQAGNFSVDPREYSITAKYLENTAIVEFRFKDTSSEFLLHDFMVPQPVDACDRHFLVRKFKGVKGESNITLFFSPKANYAKETYKEDEALKDQIPILPWDSKIEPALILKTQKEILILYIPKNAQIVYTDKQYEIHLTIAENETQSIVMEYAVSTEDSTLENREFEKETEKFWKTWISKGQFFDFCKELLIRSAITLKLMQFYPTGALVAAPTTSLPEEIGGIRNWDYRYVWIRDATFTLYAFSVLGYKEEAEKFFRFIQRITEQCSEEEFDISLMYTITGEPVPQESTLDYLSGYKKSKPVRVGNGAAEQFQLDVYGALIDAHYFTFKHQEQEKEDIHAEFILQLVDKIEELWQEPDRGIWEVRTGDKHFTYSKVMAWVGVDRAARLFKLMEQEDNAQRCKVLAGKIKKWIWDNCYDESKKIFRQYPETDNQDATSYLFVLLQFLDKHDPRTRTILENTSKELTNKGVFVYRYLTEDGLPRGEGAFFLCTFWLISAWAILEDTEKAFEVFYKLENYMNKNYLLSEELDPHTGEYLGNYPQAFSHQGLIMSAYYIHRYKQKKIKMGG
jgi:GH15 family glucan-1,4-alpha-glucosidase